MIWISIRIEKPNIYFVMRGQLDGEESHIQVASTTGVVGGISTTSIQSKID